jgi:hypothetical protein
VKYLAYSSSIKIRAISLLLLAVISSANTASSPPEPAKLRPDAEAAFQGYVRLTDARNQSEITAENRWLWVDFLPEKERAEAFSALKRGEIKMKRLETLQNGKTIDCPGAMIPHWIGLAFIPGAKLDEVLAVLKDYNHHSLYYTPDVERAKIESQDGNRFRVFLRFRRHKVITVVLNTEHQVEYFRDTATKAHSRSSAIRIAQVENGGSPGEREKTPGNDDGFLWHMETWWRIQECDGGVYIQSEAATLTRDIPTGLGWLVGPFVTSIPKETLSFTLGATRDAVRKRTER